MDKLTKEALLETLIPITLGMIGWVAFTGYIILTVIYPITCLFIALGGFLAFMAYLKLS